MAFAPPSEGFRADDRGTEASAEAHVRRTGPGAPPAGPRATAASTDAATPLLTPDGRYLVVHGRLWRASNPALDPALRQELVDTLMAARRAVRDANGDFRTLQDARHAINDAKRRLGERGPVWWSDGAPDYNRRMARGTPYAAWYASIETSRPASGRDGSEIDPGVNEPGR